MVKLLLDTVVVVQLLYDTEAVEVLLLDTVVVVQLLYDTEAVEVLA